MLWVPMTIGFGAGAAVVAAWQAWKCKQEPPQYEIIGSDDEALFVRRNWITEYWDSGQGSRVSNVKDMTVYTMPLK
jgi:hypothetical protein